MLAVTTSAHKIDPLEQLGADEVLLAEDLQFGELALALTEDKGVEVTLNNVGAAAFEQCFYGMAQFGRMVILGEVSRGQVQLSPAEILFKDVHIMGSSGTSRENLIDVARMVSWGRIKPVIYQKLPLDKALDGYRMMLERESIGVL